MPNKPLRHATTSDHYQAYFFPTRTAAEAFARQKNATGFSAEVKTQKGHPYVICSRWKLSDRRMKN